MKGADFCPADPQVDLNRNGAIRAETRLEMDAAAMNAKRPQHGCRHINQRLLIGGAQQ